MSIKDIYCHMEDFLLNEGGTERYIASSVFAGCSSSDDGVSSRSGGTNNYVPVLGCYPVNRRPRKLLQPRRAPMYGTEVQCEYLVFFVELPLASGLRMHFEVSVWLLQPKEAAGNSSWAALTLHAIHLPAQ